MIKNGVFPPQMLSIEKKDDEWKKYCVDGIISRHLSMDEYKQQMKTAYDLMNSVLDENDFKYVTNPYKVTEGFPAKLQNINIIRGKIQLLMGEESKRPDAFIVYSTDEDIADEVKEMESTMIFSAIEENILLNTSAEDQQESEALQKRLEEIKEYVSSKHFNPAEQAANNSLKYLKEKLDLKDEFLRGWEDALVAGEEIYYVGIVNGDPIVERVNPLTFSYDRDPELKYIEEGEWTVRELRMTPSGIYDRFYDIMEEEDLRRMLNLISSENTNYGEAAPKLNTNYISYTNLSSNFSYPGSGTWDDAFYHKGQFLSVFHATWTSYKKIGYVTITDEEGNVEEIVVDETYKAFQGEKVEWDWITEKWEGYRIGSDIYVGIQPIENQDYNIETMNSRTGVYFGGFYNANNTEGKSLVQLMKPLQYMYIILWYRLELAIARDKGRVLNMDITQIPKSMGIDPMQWMHYLSAMGVNFINPYEEGFEIPGRSGGKAAQFNQMSSVDLSMANSIAEYINLLGKVEQMIGEISGVSPQRQGAVAQRELVGNVERSVIQSSHITEPLFFKHDRIKRNVYNALLNTAKLAWRNSNKKHIGFVLNNNQRAFINLNDDFLYSEHDVFVGDSLKQHSDREALKQLYQPAVQNGATLLDIATIMTEDTMSEIKLKLEEIDKRKAQAEQHSNEMQAQANEIQAQANEMQLQIKQEELRIKEEDSIRRADTDIQIALIQQETSFLKEGEIEDDGNEERRLSLQKEKQTKEYNIKKEILSETIRHNKAVESISKMAKNKTTK